MKREECWDAGAGTSPDYYTQQLIQSLCIEC